MCSDGLAGYWLPQFLPAFMERHPNIDLALFSTPDRYTTRLPLFLDLRIQYTESGSGRLGMCARVGTMHFMLFAAQRIYRRARYNLAAIRSLAGSPPVGPGARRCWSRGKSRRMDEAILSQRASHQREWRAMRDRAPWRRHRAYSDIRQTVPELHPLFRMCFRRFRLPTPLYVCYDRENAKRPAVRAWCSTICAVRYSTNPQCLWFRDPERSTPDATWSGIYADALAELYPKPSRKRAVGMRH